VIGQTLAMLLLVQKLQFVVMMVVVSDLEMNVLFFNHVEAIVMILSVVQMVLVENGTTPPLKKMNIQIDSLMKIMKPNVHMVIHVLQTNKLDAGESISMILIHWILACVHNHMAMCIDESVGCPQSYKRCSENGACIPQADDWQ
jgi:hypothetical protein